MKISNRFFYREIFKKLRLLNPEKRKLNGNVIIIIIIPKHYLHRESSEVECV